MSLRTLQSLAVSTTAVLGIAAAPAVAQHYHGPGYYNDPHGHLDYHDGHYDYHSPTHSQSGPIYIRPQPRYVVPSHPGYGSPPQTATFDGKFHDHDHAGMHAPPRITSGGFSHVDDLAVTLEGQANDLCLDLHYNYQHNPGFRETYREAYEILTTAKYIHGLEHAGNRDKIRQAVAELDGLVRHVQDDMAGWTGHFHRRVGHGGLEAKLGDVQRTLYHLMDDVGMRNAPSERGLPEQVPPADYPLPADYPPPADYSPRIPDRATPYGDPTPFGAAPSRDQVPYRERTPLDRHESIQPHLDGARAQDPIGPAPDGPPAEESIGPPPDDVPLLVPN